MPPLNSARPNCYKMSTATLARCVFGRKVPDFVGLTALVLPRVPRRYQWKLVKVPEPGVDGKSYRRIVHFKDEYTVEPLEVTNLAGRDPVTGERDDILFASLSFFRVMISELYHYRLTEL